MGSPYDTVHWNWRGQPTFDQPSNMWGYTATDTYTPGGDWTGKPIGQKTGAMKTVGSEHWWDELRGAYEGWSVGPEPQSNFPGRYNLYPGYYRSDNPRGRAIYQRPSVMTSPNAPGGSGTYNYFSSQLPVLGWVTSGGKFERNLDWTPDLMPSDISWSRGGNTTQYNVGGRVNPTVDPDDPEDPVDPTLTKWEAAGMTYDEWASPDSGGDEAFDPGETDPGAGTGDIIDPNDPFDPIPTKKNKPRVKSQIFLPVEENEQVIRDSVGSSSSQAFG